MSIQDEIERLQGQLDRLKSQQARCAHTFTDAVQGTRELKVPRVVNRPVGSDFFNPVLDGFDTKHVPVWRRHCTKCGLRQETGEAEEVTVKTEMRPRF